MGLAAASVEGAAGPRRWCGRGAGAACGLSTPTISREPLPTSTCFHVTLYFLSAGATPLASSTLFRTSSSLRRSLS